MNFYVSARQFKNFVKQLKLTNLLFIKRNQKLEILFKDEIENTKLFIEFNSTKSLFN